MRCQSRVTALARERSAAASLHVGRRGVARDAVPSSSSSSSSLSSAAGQKSATYSPSPSTAARAVESFAGVWSHHRRPSAAAEAASATPVSDVGQPMRALYPNVRVRALTDRPAASLARAAPRANSAVSEENDDALHHAAATEMAAAASSLHAEPVDAFTLRGVMDSAVSGSTRTPAPARSSTPQARRPQLLTTHDDGDVADAIAAAPAAEAPADETPHTLGAVQSFVEAAQQQVDQARLARNQTIPYPTHPDALVPAFRRIKRHTKQEVVLEDPDYPRFPRKDTFIALPPARKHPWLKNTPMGSSIVHGDGQLNVVGTGEIGFEDAALRLNPPPSAEAKGEQREEGGEPRAIGTPDSYEDPRHVDTLTLRQRRRGWRGLQHQSVLHRHLPERNGKALQDAVIKHSFTLTGRGVFATRDIQPGETIMIVQSTAQGVGVKGEFRRLEDMVVELLLSAYGSNESEKEPRGASTGAREESKRFLHEWVLTGQPSSLLEHWPTASTQRVLDAIGGVAVLDALELHPIHIARLAAIMDLNSFLVESFYAERKGMAYFPEAGFLNHSCAPNATYDVMPEQAFTESDYYLDETYELHAHDDDNGDGAGAAPPREPGDTATPGTAEPAEGPADNSPPSSPLPSASPSALDVTPHGERDYLALAAELPDLTAAGAPSFLFCCRAEKLIKAGEEILISYVPPEWTFDNRQYVLYDRYHFWCKCPKCAPRVDAQYAKVPRFLVGIVVVSVLLQMLLVGTRARKHVVDEDADELASMTPAERLQELRDRGIDVEALMSHDVEDQEFHRQMRDSAQRRKEEARRKGVFELIEDRKRRKAFRMDGAAPESAYMESQNPYPHKPPTA